jgi:hypothetical protein
MIKHNTGAINGFIHRKLNKPNFEMYMDATKLRLRAEDSLLVVEIIIVAMNNNKIRAERDLIQCKYK